MTELAVYQGNALAMHGEQPFWNEHQIAALRQLGVDRATNGDLAVFHHVCQRTGLDPFARQIYMIERQGKQTIQTGIDGYRLVARRAVDRTREALSIGSAEWCGPDGVWRDVWLSNEPPAAARVTVKRGAGEFPAIALWREYAQTKRDGDLTSMWASRPAGQLAKCAEALALRKAFPQDLSGVYTDDEMGQADRPEPIRRHAEPAPAADRMGAILHAEQIETPADPPSSAVEGDPGGERGEASPSGDSPPLMTKRTQGQLFALFAQKGVAEAEQLPGVNHICDSAYTSRSQITEADGLLVIEILKKRPDAETGGE